MWPNARISVMGGEQAATVMTEVGQPEVGAQLRDQYEHQGRPVYSTARLWDDGIIDPRETRFVLAQALAVAACTPLGERGLRRISDVVGRGPPYYELFVPRGPKGGVGLETASLRREGGPTGSGGPSSPSMMQFHLAARCGPRSYE